MVKYAEENNKVTIITCSYRPIIKQKQIVLFRNHYKILFWNHCCCNVWQRLLDVSSVTLNDVRVSGSLWWLVRDGQPRDQVSTTGRDKRSSCPPKSLDTSPLPRHPRRLLSDDWNSMEPNLHSLVCLIKHKQKLTFNTHCSIIEPEHFTSG